LRDTLLIIILLSVAAAVLSAWLTRFFCHPGAWLQILDHPNERSLHTCPVPRTGGIAILAATAIFVPLLVVLFGEMLGGMGWLGGGVLLVTGISFWDDRYGLSPLARLISHIIAAAILVYGGFILEAIDLPGIGWTAPVPVMAIVSLLFIVWMLNLYNFMDGMDGFAGGMAVFGFGTFAMLGGIAGHPLFTGVNLIIASAAAGFLLFNFPPARIFMGDVGSSTLGMLVAAFSLWGANDGIFRFWMALFVFSPFIVDATVTLIQRLLRGEKIWQAHKTHYYQRLVQAGWGHRKTVLLEYAIMFGCSLTALLIMHASAIAQAVTLVAWGLLYTYLLFWISRFAGSHRASQKILP